MNFEVSTVGVVIPTYTNDAVLHFLVNSLANSSLEVVVIDNKPSLKKRKLISKRNMYYLPQTENLGFARSVNVGAAQLPSEWLLLLNDDIEISVSQIYALLEFACQSKLDAVVPVFVSPTGTLENIGYSVLPIGKIELNFDITKCTSATLDGVTAACMLVRRTVYEELEGMDETFVSYLEDVDFCLRMKQMNLQFGVATNIEVLHHHRQTSKHMPVYKAKRDMINWLLLIYKHWSLRKIFRYFPGIFMERLRNISGFIRAYRYHHD